MRSVIAGCGTQIVDCDCRLADAADGRVVKANLNGMASAKLEEAKEAGAQSCC